MLLKKVFKNFELNVMVFLLAIITVTVFIQIVARYVFHQSLFWSEELVRYLFIWMVMFGFSVGVQFNKHIRIRMLLDRFSPSAQSVINIIVNILFMIYAVVIAIVGIRIVFTFITFNQYSPAMQIPMHYVYLACPVGFGLTTIRLIHATVLEVKSLTGKGKKGETSEAI